MITMPNDVRLADIEASMEVLLKSQARIYMHLARATIDRFGRDGEMTVRLGLRAFGHWRAMEMREAHHAMGRPIDMRTLMTCWDNASTYVDKGPSEAADSYEPGNVEFNVHFCPASEAWKDADFHHMGHWYCDEFHQACASTYHPDGNVTIHENLMKGDDHCHFRWIMPPNARELDLGAPTELGERLAVDYQAASDLEGAWKSLKRSNRLLGGHYFTCAQPVMDRHGAEGREAVIAGLTSWGAERGRLLRERHEADGLALSAENFVRHHDLPARLIWPVREIDMSARRAIVEIDETPQDDAWDDAGLRDLGALWYDVSYAAMADAYRAGSTATWSGLTARGDATNRLEMTLAD